MLGADVGLVVAHPAFWGLLFVCCVIILLLDTAFDVPFLQYGLLIRPLFLSGYVPSPDYRRLKSKLTL